MWYDCKHNFKNKTILNSKFASSNYDSKLKRRVYEIELAYSSDLG